MVKVSGHFDTGGTTVGASYLTGNPVFNSSHKTHKNKKQKQTAKQKHRTHYIMNNFPLYVFMILAMAPWASARLGGHRKLKSVSAANRKIPGQYIVLLNDNVQDVPGSLNSILNANENAKIHHFYQRALRGVLLSNVPDQLLQRLLDSTSVKAVYEVSTNLSS